MYIYIIYIEIMFNLKSFDFGTIKSMANFAACYTPLNESFNETCSTGPASPVAFRHVWACTPVLAGYGRSKD